MQKYRDSFGQGKIAGVRKFYVFKIYGNPELEKSLVFTMADSILLFKCKDMH